MHPKGKIMKANKLFIIDFILLILFVLTAVSGFGMHFAGHSNIHSIWHNWAVIHCLSTLLFVGFTFAHIYLHWNWYKTLFSKPLGNKSRVTIVVSILFVVLTISGTLAFTVPEGPNSHIGIVHYIIGIISTIFFVGHIVKRHKILFKGLLKKK